MNVTVTSARTVRPSTRPVSAQSPDGMSSANTGFAAALICSIARAKPGRTSPLAPVPISASTMTAPATSNAGAGISDFDNGHPQRHSPVARKCRIARQRRSAAELDQLHRGAARARTSRDDVTITGIVAAAAHDADRVDVRPALLQRRPRRPAGPLHQHDAGNAVTFDGEPVERARLCRGEQPVERGT